MFVDAETDIPLEDESSFESLVVIRPQFTVAEFAKLVEQFETAAKVGVSVTLIEIILIFSAKNIIFSMWTLVLTLQFFVFIAKWQISYPHRVRFILHEFRRMVLGEFLDDFDFGKEVSSFFGLPTSED